MGSAGVSESKVLPEVKIDMPPNRGGHGHGRLAAFMGTFPEAAIFHRFAALNAQNILYLQAELLWLEDELKQVAGEDARSLCERQREYSKNWFLLSHSSDEPGCDSRQWRIFMKIRAVLDQYNKAILQQKEIVKMEPPGRLALSLLNEWMQSPSNGDISLSGDDFALWRSMHPPDLLALMRKEPDDLLSIGIAQVARRWLHPVVKRLSKEGRSTKRAEATHFLERTTLTHTPILYITSFVALALSSILPLGSILILHAAKTVPVRLGIIAAFTVFFSLCVGVVTRSRRVEIFAAAAAYAAIQVVFIAGEGARDISQE